MQTTCVSASATHVAYPSPPPASRAFARHPSGVWLPCAHCGLEQPEAPDCTACGTPLLRSPIDGPVGEPIQIEWSAADLVLPMPKSSVSLVARRLPQSPQRPQAQESPRYQQARRVELDVAADYRGRELSHAPSPTISLAVLALAAFCLFHAASWFIDFTGGEVRAMARVVDRLALPPTACESCEKPFRIVELRARPYYDPPSEQVQLYDPQRAVPSQAWVEAMRREVEEAKAWAEESKRMEAEEAERSVD